MLRKIILITAIMLIINTSACFHRHSDIVFQADSSISKKTAKGNTQFDIELVRKLYKKSNSIIKNTTHNIYVLLLKNNYSTLLPLIDNCDISLLMINEALENQYFQNYQLNDSDFEKIRMVWTDVALAKNYLLFCQIMLAKIRMKTFSQANFDNKKMKLPGDELPELWYLRQKYLQCDVLEKAYRQLLITNANLPLQRINFKDSFEDRLKKIIEDNKSL